jgi:hypothetical protein
VSLLGKKKVALPKPLDLVGQDRRADAQYAAAEDCRWPCLRCDARGTIADITGDIFDEVRDEDTHLIQDNLGHWNSQHTVRYTATNPVRFEKPSR